MGDPCNDLGEELPLHGSIANTPVEQVNWSNENGTLIIRTVTSDEQIFGRKLTLSRTISFPIAKDEFTLSDTITNTGCNKEAFEILYHMNMGYPLLDEDSIVRIASKKVIPRNEHAAGGIKDWMKMEKPTAGYQERCYYHEMGKKGHASIFQPKERLGLSIDYDAEDLDCFIEWKMMGIRDYALGLECGNAYPDGRDVMRKKGILKFLSPGEKKTYTIKISMMDKDNIMLN